MISRLAKNGSVPSPEDESKQEKTSSSAESSKVINSEYEIHQERTSPSLEKQELKPSEETLIAPLIVSAKSLSKGFFNFITKDSVILIFFVLLAYTSIHVFIDKGAKIAYNLFSPLEDGYVKREESSSNLASKAERAKLKREIRLERDNRLKSTIKNLNATETEKTRLLEQVEEIHRRAKVHLDVTKFFYVQYYVSISLVSNAVFIAAICLILISKKGWEKSNSRLVHLFIVSSGVAAIFSAFIVAFKYDNNIADNKQLYIAYTALEARVLSYFSTGELVVKINPDKATTSTKAVAVIQQIDTEMATLHNIAVGFDLTKVPNYQELYKGIAQ
jgi:hypothetical protein